MSENSTKASDVRIHLRIEGEGEEAKTEATATYLDTGKIVSGTVSCREAEDGSLVVDVAF